MMPLGICFKGFWLVCVWALRACRLRISSDVNMPQVWIQGLDSGCILWVFHSRWGNIDWYFGLSTVLVFEDWDEPAWWNRPHWYWAQSDDESWRTWYQVSEDDPI